MHKGKIQCVGICSALLTLVGCTTVAITGRERLDLIPAGQLAAMAESSFKELLAQSKLSAEPSRLKIMEVVSGKLVQAAGDLMREQGRAAEMADLRWDFKLIAEDKTVNAFAMPGGKVAVYTGILPFTQDEAGLAVVLGHEIAHLLARHGEERMTQQLLVQMGGSVLAAALNRQPEKTRDIFMAVYGAGSTFGFLLPYSRTHEYEADQLGCLIMAKAGYDPRQAVLFWQRMQNQEKGAHVPEFLSTHPVAENRIAELARLAEKYYPVYQNEKSR
jgi:predicted Zn-dependent protease